MKTEKWREAAALRRKWKHSAEVSAKEKLYVLQIITTSSERDGCVHFLEHSPRNTHLYLQRRVFQRENQPLSHKKT